ncbi:hypothetical protein ERN12_05065 [Rhodobacteraceae bacterium]|nr:hypothetical protein ERN12_05065 [Paracoccaceae bacterium]
MIIDFTAMLAAGVLAGLVAFALRHAVTKFGLRGLPKWVVPAAAGVAMLGYTIYAEYSWYPQLRDGLAGDVAVVMTVEDSNWWRPWTFAAPVITRFIAVDRDRLSHPVADLSQGNLLLLARWQAPRAVPVAFDCKSATRADLVGGAQIENGKLQGGRWIDVGADDPALQAFCSTGGRHG